jgi:hypothetical protein
MGLWHFFLSIFFACVYEPAVRLARYMTLGCCTRWNVTSMFRVVGEITKVLPNVGFANPGSVKAWVLNGLSLSDGNLTLSPDVALPSSMWPQSPFLKTQIANPKYQFPLILPKQELLGTTFMPSHIFVLNDCEEIILKKAWTGRTLTL